MSMLGRMSPVAVVLALALALEFIASWLRASRNQCVRGSEAWHRSNHVLTILRPLARASAVLWLLLAAAWWPDPWMTLMCPLNAVLTWANNKPDGDDDDFWTGMPGRVKARLPRLTPARGLAHA